jgi:cytochrome P450
MDGTFRIQGFDDLDFDPFETYDRGHGWEAVENPYAKMAILRAQAPVHKGSFRETFGSPADATLAHMEHYTLYGHEVVDRSLQNATEFSNHIYEFNIGRAFGRSITAMDAPEHMKFRLIFQKVFLPKQIVSWGNDDVVPVVNELIDRFADKGEAELVNAFTVLYPFRFIYRQLGLPVEDVETFHSLAVGLMCIITDAPHGMEANRKLGEYFAQLLKERRHKPGDDLISGLVHAEVDGEHLPDEVIISFLRQLLNAGGDTTFRSTGSTLAGLLSNPDQLAKLRADRSLMPQTIAEGLRWEPPTTQIYRTPVRDMELGGVQIPAGAALDVVIAAANRDPAVFENPDEFDIFRPQKRSTTFGFGPHICIGQHLARLEMAVAINALLDRLPKLRLDDRKPAPKIIGLTKRSPDRLYVRFD